MREKSLRINIVNKEKKHESINFEPGTSPELKNLSLGEIVQGEKLSEKLEKRKFKVTGAQSNTGTPHCYFLDSPKYLLLKGGLYGNKKGKRGVRIRKRLFPKKLIENPTALELVEI